jgi:hypothetical protein
MRSTAVRQESERGVGLLAREGGLLVVGGPPLGGKSVLASRLAECLPQSIKLETIDNLAQEDELWYPDGPTGKAVASPNLEMLKVARRLWSRRRSESPVIIVSGRFDTPAARSAARETARSAGMPFLFVEARSNDIRALRRISILALPTAEMVKRLDLYEKTVRGYLPVRSDEARAFRLLRLGRVLGNLDGALVRVLEAWGAA